MSAKDMKAIADIGITLGYSGDELKQFVNDERMRIDKEKELERQSKEAEVEKETERQEKEKETERKEAEKQREMAAVLAASTIINWRSRRSCRRWQHPVRQSAESVSQLSRIHVCE